MMVVGENGGPLEPQDRAKNTEPLFSRSRLDISISGG